MAFLLSNSSIASHFRSTSRVPSLPSRGFHVEPGPREKALLAEDPAIKRFKSHKKGVRAIKRMGDVLTIVIVAGFCYEIYVKAVMREEAREAQKQAIESA